MKELTTSQKLTKALKKAKKITWYGLNHYPVDFVFVYYCRSAFDINFMDNPYEAIALLDEIDNLICELYPNLTECQKRILEL